MKNSRYILIILLLVYISISCKRDNSVDDISFSYLSESINVFKFQTGTYWIFQDDSTQTLDSVVVVSTENDFYWSPPSIHGQSGEKSEYFKMYIKSYGASETFNYYLTNNYIKLNGGGEYGQDGQPIFMADCEIGTEFNGMEIQEKIQSLIINSNTFNNVIKVKITASKQYQPVYTNDTYLYFEENVGLIKKVIDLGNSEFESYSIKDWNLIK